MAVMSLLDEYDAFLFDLDGTIYRGEEPVPGAGRAVDAAHEKGVRVRFVTNNASRGPDEVAGHLTDMGIRATPEEVSTSSQAGAAVLADKLQPGALVLVVGSEALVHEVELRGLTTTRRHSDAVQAVVQGLNKDTNWWDLAEACISIRAGALWVACNVDPTLPTERGPLPGNASVTGWTPTWPARSRRGSTRSSCCPVSPPRRTSSTRRRTCGPPTSATTSRPSARTACGSTRTGTGPPRCGPRSPASVSSMK